MHPEIAETTVIIMSFVSPIHRRAVARLPLEFDACCASAKFLCLAAIEDC